MTEKSTNWKVAEALGYVVGPCSGQIMTDDCHGAPLTDYELTEADVEHILQIANDKNAPTGRYRGTPKAVPLSSDLTDEQIAED